MSSPSDVTEARWSRMEELFDAALNLPPEQRESYLDETCTDDKQLRAEVEALIKANETGGARVQELIRSAAGKALANTATTSQQVGPYTILSTIGQGGMGAVYLAERSDQEFEQRVAVKLLHKTMVTPELLQRFRSERQILADLNHPNIAHLIDGGTTEDGVPYIVMEYVEGKPINQYCDDNRLSVTERLDLFRQVCSALEMAHQNLIVHRDIKPNNILVARDGTPKLLDFGIAKSLSGIDGVENDLTRMGDRLLTPNHASPEQVAGRAVTTASDVYSLGVLLYELLCGVCPFSLNALSPAQMEKVVTEVEPESPSKLLMQGANADPVEGRAVCREPEAVAMDRGTTLDKLRRQLEGDLDNIVLYALRKDRTRRYRSVSLLSEDIRRHLRGLPVTARPDSWRYRAGKFVQRNRITVAIGTLFVAFMAGFTVLTALQNAKLVESNEKAQIVIGVLKDILVAGDPLEDSGGEITILEVLDRGSKKVSEELGDHPLEQADLQQTIGSVYARQGKYEKGAQNLINALETRESLLGREDPLLVRNLLLLGNVEVDRNELDRAGELLRRALALSEKRSGDPSEELALSQRRYAMYLRKRNNFSEAEQYYRASIDTYERLGPQYDEGRAGSIRGLGVLFLDRGLSNEDYEKSVTLGREALKIDLRTLGESHPLVGLDRNNIGYSLLALRDLEKAGPMLEEAVAILTNSYTRYTKNHPDVALAISNLARYHALMYHYEEAEQLYSQAIDMAIALLDGKLNDSVAFDKQGLAEALQGQGRYDEAETVFLESISIYESLKNQRKPLSESLRRYGGLLFKQGRFVEAEEVLRRSLEMSQAVHAAGSWPIGLGQSDLGAVFVTTGRNDQALILLESAVEILRKTLGEDHHLTNKARERLEAVP